MSNSETISKIANICQLDDRRLLGIQGDDAEDFLERVVTCSVSSLTSGGGKSGALLTPQGKISNAFLIFRYNNCFYLDTHINHIESLAKQFRMLRMRAKVEITIRDDITIYSLNTNSNFQKLPSSLIFEDNRFNFRELPESKKVFRIFFLPGDHEPEDVPMVSSETKTFDYESLRIAAGIPEFEKDYCSREVFPTDVNLDFYGGIDYNKGCFIGQEVVSRMRRRGTIRKRTVKIFGNALEKNAEVRTSTLLGYVTSVCGDAGLACLRVDKLIGEETITVNEHPVKIVLPNWLNTETQLR